MAVATSSSSSLIDMVLSDVAKAALVAQFKKRNGRFALHAKAQTALVNFFAPARPEHDARDAREVGCGDVFLPRSVF